MGDPVGVVSLNYRDLSLYLLCSDAMRQGIHACKNDIFRYRPTYPGELCTRSLAISPGNTSVCSAAKDVNSSQDVLVNLFERIECFF